MKIGVFERNAPFNRDGDVTVRSFAVKQHAGFDVVVIGERNQCVQIQLFDLPALQIIGGTGAKWSAPVYAREIDRLASRFAVTLRLPMQKLSHHRQLLHKMRQVAEPFLRMFGVTVEGNSRTEGAEGRAI